MTLSILLTSFKNPSSNPSNALFSVKSSGVFSIFKLLNSLISSTFLMNSMNFYRFNDIVFHIKLKFTVGINLANKLMGFSAHAEQTLRILASSN